LQPASNETSGAGYWKVTAPREITQVYNEREPRWRDEADVLVARTTCSEEAGDSEEEEDAGALRVPRC
jgi:hypothetical protein